MNSKVWYKPREVAKLGLIKSTGSGKSVAGNYAFIMRLIKSGELKSRNYCKTGKEYYLINIKEIEKYHKGEWLWQLIKSN